MNLSSSTPLKIVTYTTLFPNSEQPTHGVFVENRLRNLVETGAVNARVVAPVPWFPSSAPIFGRYATVAKVVPHETRFNLHIEHPKHLILPKIGMNLVPSWLVSASFPILRRLQAEDDFALIDAHYFYPDGVAAVELGRRLNKPVVITARGTDVNYIPRYPKPRRMIIAAAQAAAGIIAVSQAIKDAIVDLGIPAEKVVVLRNGVDLELFHPAGRDEARESLKLQGRVLLSVGHLIERKGHNFPIQALSSLPGVTLLIAGAGPERNHLESLAKKLNVQDRVGFLGSVSHHELQKVYAAADALVLASSREGWPNVLLESMACGTPVVATPIWGNPEVVSDPAAGVLMKARTAEAVVEGVERLFRNLPDRTATRRYAEAYSWDDTSQGQIRLFRDIIRTRTAA
jgi:teichuronic acid biosynthesis glycosyltransferase TuaC